MVTVPELALKLEAQLGEGPYWDARAGLLRFVDIKSGLLHAFDPLTGEQQTRALGGMPSFVVGDAEGGLVLGSGDEIFRLDAAGNRTMLARIPQPEHNRTNDATVDPRGRLWVATMDDDEQVETGTLWRFDAQGLHPAGTRAVVTDGPAVSADGRLLYCVNSGERTITRYPLSAEGTLGKGDIFVRLAEAEGYPDGIVLDAHGNLWVGLWDGWGVRRYGPDGGLQEHIAFPCARVTKLAFGGPELRTAFVTTARVGLSARQLADQPLAGSLFRFEAELPGIELPRCAVS